MNSKIFTLLIALLVLDIFCYSPNISLCHPHMYIENLNTVVFNEKGLDGFRIKWIFDEMFTAAILNDYDKDKNSQFSPDEENLLYNKVFNNLKEVQYFCDIEIEGKPFVVDVVKDFHAEVKDNKLIYNFFVPCPVSASSTQKKIIICIYDETCFVDIYLQDKNLHLENADKYDYEYTINENYDKNFLAPKELTLFFKEKSK